MNTPDRHTQAESRRKASDTRKTKTGRWPAMSSIGKIMHGAFAALAVKPAAWRRSAGLATLALGLGGIVSTAQAALLVYEPFDYTPGQSLDGQGGGPNAVGMIGVWTVGGNGTSPFDGTNNVQVIAPNLNPGPFWKGTCTSVPQKGVYAGSAATPGFNGQNGNNPNNMWAWRPLDPSITTNFTRGSTTWMSCVQSQNFNANNNYAAMTFCLGAGVQNGNGDGGDPAPGRGTGVQGGPAVGLGLASSGWGSASPKYLIAGVWDNLGTDGLTFIEENNQGNAGIQVVIPGQTPPVWINLVKIVWGDLNNPTTVTMAAFKDGAALSEAAFNQFASTNLQTVTSSYNVDPTTFTNISLGGGRWNCDELRIGTTFNDVIGYVPATSGYYWAPGASGGGTGIWAAGANVWTTIPNVRGTNSQSPASMLVFGGTSGTVTVNGTVTVGAGFQFSIDGYNLVAGTSSPQISLAGANAAANVINVNSGATVTNNVSLVGTNGLSKAGLGTLILRGANTYGGGTVLGGGTLQITDATSLGSGNVIFEGGTLQYPPGTGATALDVSSRIPTVASGQVVKIDTGGYDVTFVTGIGAAGGMAKLGGGSLTLASANTYAGPTTVSAGSLNVSGASGVIATLNVPAGGTVNLGAGAVVGTLNVIGGTVNLVGTGAQVGTLFVSGGTFQNPSLYALTVTNSANLVGVQLSLSGANSFTLNGADLLNPTPSAHRVTSATGGTLSFVVQGLDVAIGQGSPGIPASPATAHFYGSGVWDLVNGVATDINNTYGKDNHAFHYVQLPSGDFDIKCRVTGVTNAAAGLMVRDNLVSEWDSRTGNYIGIYTALGNSVTAVSANNQSAASHAVPPWVNSANFAQGMVTPYLEIKRTGNIVTMSCSNDGSTYTEVQQVDYALSPWGPKMYLGLDLINTATGGGSGAFDEVNFMGTAGIADLSTTEFALNNGAKLDLGPVMYVNQVSTNGVALANGCWAGSALSGANHIAPAIFASTGTGIAVIGTPLTVTVPDVTVTTSDPGASVAATYPAPVIVGGTPPYTTKYVPDSSSLFPVGISTVTCTVTDSSCPFAQIRHGSFRVNVAPPAPALNRAVDANTGFTLPGGVPTLTFRTVAGFRYRVVFTDLVANPPSAWSPLVSEAQDPNGWVYATGSYTTIIGPSSLAPVRFYRVEASAP